MVPDEPSESVPTRPTSPSSPAGRPPAEPPPLENVVAFVGRYPIDAFRFVQAGLYVTARAIHGQEPAGGKRGGKTGGKTGRQADREGQEPAAPSQPPPAPAERPRPAEAVGHASAAGATKPTSAEGQASRHVSGAQLCEGIRAFAVDRWGYLAATVLRRWNVTDTLDFGRIVFALIEHGHMSKTDDDRLDDFKDVFDFEDAFEAAYRMPGPPA